LYNGSVPTLYDLLLPPDQRTKQFPLGHRDYDPRKNGYTLDGDREFEFDTKLDGNSNVGHECGIDLSEDDRSALLEFLKTQ